MQKLTTKYLAVVALSFFFGASGAQELSSPRSEITDATRGGSVGFLGRAGATAQDAFESSTDRIAAMLDSGLNFLGIKYRFGGNGPETGGFDCSGLVKKIFSDALGVNLPRTAVQMAQMGEKVGRQDLKPGDLVFFNTMRRTFSHVGIYLGDSKFLHAPSAGGVVRVDDIDNAYWQRHFTGARRMVSDTHGAPL